MTQNNSIVWLRNDLRLNDNPALYEAREASDAVVPVFILDEAQPKFYGGASKWWLHHSLVALSVDFERIGAHLVLRSGDSAYQLEKLVEETGATAIYWNRRYFARHVEIDKSIKSHFQDRDIAVKTFNGSLLREPWEVETKTGGHYKVYSPFWRSLKEMGPARASLTPTPRKLDRPKKSVASDNLNDWKLLPSNPNWARSFPDSWKPGQSGAHERMNEFLRGPVNDYGDKRNRPDVDFTSKLSPHLAFGEISPNEIWERTNQKIADGEVNSKEAEKFLSEIAWREFSHNLLFYYKDLPTKPLREEFQAFDWCTDEDGLTAWHAGQTGFPIVDAGMRQLWKTGWMHNRVRMIVASFLVKNMLVPWQDGEEWFWDTLVDADVANNSASWQWVAGCGADAAPYFRIFNPVTQSEKFDPQGDYIKEFVPELAKMPKKYIHKPWEASSDILAKADVTLGNSYPKPILDLSTTRKRALDRYHEIKKSN